MHYRFTGDLPIMLGDLSHPAEYDHDRTAIVHRADPDAPDEIPGATIVLNPGDTFEVSDELEPIAHALIEPIPDEELPVVVEQVRTAAEKRRQARDAADAIAAAADEAAATQDGSDGSAQSLTGEIPTPQTGADGKQPSAPDSPATADADSTEQKDG